MADNVQALRLPRDLERALKGLAMDRCEQFYLRQRNMLFDEARQRLAAGEDPQRIREALGAHGG